MFNNKKISASAKAHNKKMLQEILEDMIKESMGTLSKRDYISVFYCESCGRLLYEHELNPVYTTCSAEDYYGVSDLFPYSSGSITECECECPYCRADVDPGDDGYDMVGLLRESYYSEFICIFCGCYAPYQCDDFYFLELPMCSDCLFSIVEFNNSFITSVIKISYEEHPSIRDALLEYFKTHKFEEIENLCYKHSDFQCFYADELARVISYVITYSDDVTFEKLKALGYEGDINSIIAMAHKFLDDYDYLIEPIKRSYDYRTYIKGGN